MVQTNTNTNKVQASNTINNDATTYTVTYTNDKNCIVKVNDIEYSGKLLNTSPTTHLHYNGNDILLPSKIDIDGVQVSTKANNYEGNTNQLKFANFLKLIQGKTFTFTKQNTPHATRKASTKKVNIFDYINNDTKLLAQYNTLKQAFDKAKNDFDTFIAQCTQKQAQAQAKTQLQAILKSGVLSPDIITQLVKGGDK